MISSIPVTTVSRIVSALIAALLLYFAFVQGNDPDPVLWIGLYLVCALVPLLALFGYRSTALFRVAVVACVAAMAWTVGGVIDYLPRAGEESLLQDMSPDKPYIEETREFIGTGIAFCLVILATLVSRGTAEAQAL